MKKQWSAITITVATATTALLILFWLMGDIGSGISTPALAAPTSPTVTDVYPAVAPNDIDTPIAIQGTDFSAALSGTVVITAPMVYLGDHELAEVIWVDTTTLSATVPWGLIPEVYSLTVVNPDGISSTLQNAFTVTQGIGVWTTNGPYGGSITELRFHPNIPITLYAIAHDAGLFVSYDSGANWQPLLMEQMDQSIEFDAGNPDIIYLGANLYRSMDDGQTWEILRVHNIPGHSWLYYPTAHPTEPGVVYVASRGITTPDQEGGIHRSNDYGENWITLTQGISDTDFTKLAIHPTNPDTLLAGTENGNLYYSQNGGQDWHWAAQIDNAVLRLFFNPYQPLEAWATANPDTNEGSYLYKSTDLSTWTPVIVDAGLTVGGQFGWDLAFLTDTIWAGSGRVYSSTNGGDSWTETQDGYNGWITSMAVHPERPEHIYVGTDGIGVFNSFDAGLTWQEINQGLSGVKPTALVVAPDDPDTVYTKIDRGLLKSVNGGQSWRLLGFQGGFPTRTKLAIDPYQPERLYFGHGCPDTVCLWISDDAGESWISVTATLPVTYTGWEGAFYTLAPHPDVPGRILAGVEIWPSGSAFWIENEGLFFASDDYGATWNHLGPTEPISWVSEIAFDAIDPNLIYAGTRGTGLWKSTDGGQIWAAVPNPSGIADISVVATHPDIPNTVYVNADQMGNEDAGLFVSHDAGETWTHLTWQVGGQLLFAPTQPATLYTGCGLGEDFGNGLCRSLDGGQTWQKLDGMSWPTAMAVGTDGERVVIYVGTAGGVVAASSGSTSIQTVTGSSNVLGGGVYRYTTLQPEHWVFLPLVARGHTP
jgi:photosystem II stability/assembly factor-like uncharacterized protein